ncbi:uncharacterized protein DS421_2g37560 [Arachis hypogaea]|nr:uncharacterized protein DS421_2g37560 [Arachis hypogaea]
MLLFFFTCSHFCLFLNSLISFSIIYITAQKPLFKTHSFYLYLFLYTCMPPPGLLISWSYPSKFTKTFFFLFF